MNQLDRNAPVPDAVLVRWLDDEASPDEAAWVEAATSAAGAAADRVWQLRESSRRFAAAAAAIDVPPLPPLRLPRRRWLARAASLTLLLGAAAAAAMPAARALVADGVAWAVGRVRPAHEAAVPEPVDAAGRAFVGVPVPGPRLTVDIERSQRAGSLVIQRGSGPDILAGAGAAELIVLPDRLRVRNAADGTDDVVLIVPPALREIRLLLGGSVRVLRLDAAGLPDPVPLGPPTG
jgi:hypothetical protein